jgi:hypothetical protein
VFRRNRKADNAQMESEDVAAVNVLNTGDNDIRARNIKIDDFRALRPSPSTIISENQKLREYERVANLLVASSVGR